MADVEREEQARMERMEGETGEGTPTRIRRELPPETNTELLNSLSEFSSENRTLLGSQGTGEITGGSFSTEGGAFQMGSKTRGGGRRGVSVLDIAARYSELLHADRSQVIGQKRSVVEKAVEAALGPNGDGQSGLSVQLHREARKLLQPPLKVSRGSGLISE